MSALDSRFVCSGCGTALPPEEPLPFRCPRAGRDDDVDHVLARELDLSETRFPFEGDPHPFVRFRELLHSYRFARRAGWTDEGFVERVRELDRAVAAVDGAGFAFTPCTRATALESDLGLGPLWVKDETGNVAGSHKGRHLFGLALQFVVQPDLRAPRLAIASCGNAALAAGVVAKAAGWPLDAYVPPDAAPSIVRRLEELDVHLVTCARNGLPGDPCFLRFRGAVLDGATPFTCQGSENGQVIEGAQTLVWEVLAQRVGEQPIGRVAIQVGGGAIASACVQAFRDALALGAIEALPRFHMVQTAAGHPLERAWRRLVDEVARGTAGPTADAPPHELATWVRARPETPEALAAMARHRSRYMTLWEHEPLSIAKGMLDDETYDWRVLVEAMVQTGGWPLVVAEETLARARDNAQALTGVGVDATGAAGLAGLYTLAAQEAPGVDGATLCLFTGGVR